MAGGYSHDPDGTEAIVKELQGLQTGVKSGSERSVLRPFTVGGTEYQGLYVPTADGGRILVVGYQPGGSAKILDCDAAVVDVDGSSTVTIRSTAGNVSIIANAVLALTGASVNITGTLTVTNNATFNNDVTVGDDLTVTDALSVGGNVGFYGTSPQGKPTVSGSRAGNAALADLLNELAGLGLINNSTSA